MKLFQRGVNIDNNVGIEEILQFRANLLPLKEKKKFKKS